MFTDSVERDQTMINTMQFEIWENAFTIINIINPISKMNITTNCRQKSKFHGVITV